MSLSPFVSFQLRFVTYLLSFPRMCIYIYFEVRKDVNAKCAGSCEMVVSAARGIGAELISYDNYGMCVEK